MSCAGEILQNEPLLHTYSYIVLDSSSAMFTTSDTLKCRVSSLSSAAPGSEYCLLGCKVGKGSETS